jgi:hypothetical protein
MARPKFTVTVVARYLPEQSSPDQQAYAFAYSVTIVNTGDVTAQLVARRWLISDASGATQEVPELGAHCRAARPHAGQLLLHDRGRRGLRGRHSGIRAVAAVGAALGGGR